MSWRTGRFRSRDGLSLHYRDHAGADLDAPVVICLPGLLRNARDFEALATHLADRFRVICPDFRGRGLSDCAPDPLTYVPGSYVRDLDALFDALAIEEAVLIGTSLGGLVATVFAALRPERVSGVVLNDVGPDVDPAGLARVAGYVGRIAPVVTWDDAARAVATLDEAVYPGLGDAGWLRLARMRYAERSDGTVRPDHDPGIALAFALPATNPDTWPFFAEIAALPLLVLRGAISDILSRETVARMRAVAPDLVAVEVPGRGHVPLLDEPEALAAIDGFLTDMRKPPRGRRIEAGRRFRASMAGHPLAEGMEGTDE